VPPPSLLGGLLLAFCLTVSAAHAQSSPDLAGAMTAAARGQNLASQTTWLKLGHYRGRAGRFKSEVLTKRFFLSPSGAQHPEAELDATITAMAQPIGPAPDQHAQCRFPARYAWLKRHLAWPAQAPQAQCRAFGEWMQHNDIDSVSLIFVSGQLANPASYYGHVLLKFNALENAASNGLLDTSLNYGAAFPAHENPLLYIMRGVFGGYRSTFTHLAFYNHSHKYGETDLRNLWEYRLSLDPGKRDLLLAHAWELMGVENQYFFLKENCAYRMAELANLVIDEPLLPRTKAWAAPVDVFVRLMEASQDGRSVVDHIQRVPSRQTRFREDLDQLTIEGRTAVRAFVKTSSTPLQPLVAGLPAPDQAPVIEALIDYYTFAEIKSENPTGDASQIKDRLLLARLALPPATSDAPSTENAPPHLGQRSSMVQASLVSNNVAGDAIELRFRGAHHDFLTYAPGVPPDSQLALVDLSAAVRAGHVELREFELASLTNLNISETGLPHDGGTAIRFRAGAEARDLACTTCMVGYIEGGLGKAAALTRNVAVYGFLNGRVNIGNDEDGHLEAGPATGILFGPGNAWRANLEARLWQDIDGDHKAHPSISLQTRYGGSSRWDIRAGVIYQRAGDGAAVVESRLGLASFW
jgi:hypothetical protein